VNHRSPACPARNLAGTGWNGGATGWRQLPLSTPRWLHSGRSFAGYAATESCEGGRRSRITWRVNEGWESRSEHRGQATRSPPRWPFAVFHRRTAPRCREAGAPCWALVSGGTRSPEGLGVVPGDASRQQDLLPLSCTTHGFLQVLGTGTEGKMVGFVGSKATPGWGKAGTSWRP